MRFLVLSAGVLREPLDGFSKPLRKIVDKIDADADADVTLIEPSMPLNEGRSKLETATDFFEQLLRAHPSAARSLRQIAPSNVRKLAKNYDVALCYHATTFYLLQSSEIPVVLVAQDCLAGLMEGRASLATSTPQRLRLLLGARLMGWVERIAVRNSDAVTVVSELEREEISERYGASSLVVTNGVDLPAPSRNEITGRNELTFFGNLSVAKNQDALRETIQEIMPAVWEHKSDITLNVLGTGIDQLPQDLIGLDRIKYTGSVEDLRPEFERSLVTVQPHRVATGIKNSALDSLAYGVPLFASPAVLRPIFGDGKWPEEFEYKPAEDAGSLLSYLLEPDALRWQRLSSMGRSLVASEYSWAQYENVIFELLRTHSRNNNAKYS